MIVSIAMLLRGFFYLPAIADEGQIPHLARWLPEVVWAPAWLGSSVVCLILVYLRQGLPLAAGIISGIHFLWGLFYLAAWFHGVSPTGATESIEFLTVSFLLTWSFRKQITIYGRAHGYYYSRVLRS